DEAGNLWLSTIKGLNKFAPDNETFSHFDVRDGLISNEFSLGVYKSKNGEMYFGGIKGFNKFHPDSIKDIAYVSPIIITDFKLFNQSVPIGIDSSNNRSILSQSICETEQIDLTYEDYVLSFEFASLDFHVPEKINYLYKMEGFDKDWNQTGASRRYATYTNLDPGDYIFKVKRANINGNWNEAFVSIIINIHPPWWKTIWAYLLYAFLFIGSSLLLWGLQIRRIHIRHDIEMSKFEAKKLHEIDEMKSTFFANISHEFRTPLTLILDPVKELMNTEKDTGKKEELKRVHRNADMLYGLVNQLMDLSKLEAGKMTLKTCEENIVPILKGLVLSFASLAERKNITLKFDSSDEVIVAYIDIEKVEKIVINILSNAFKFTKEGKNINVDIRVREENTEIVISDEGIGISKERLKNIFDRFYQVDSSHTREHEGTGIGLALTKELVELHKGEIGVESEEGKGTTFIVRLPLGRNHLKPEEICEEMRVQEKEIVIPQTAQIIDDDEQGTAKLDINLIADTEKSLLLIVEDNTDVRNYIKGHLDKVHRIMTAVNGEDGVNKALEHIPDLIVSDVMMPKMDGFELCEKIKTDERTSHIPVILLTAKATGQDKIEGLETGADDYIMKPFDAKELQVRVKNLIEQRKRIVEHYRKKQVFDISDIDAASTDKKFLNRALEVITKHISDEEFNVDIFAKEIALSRVQLHRKLVALIGHPPGDFIRIVRLTKAAKLIRRNFGNISEIALEVGFSNPANFAKAFRVQFGVSPTEFRNKFES
ncbi:MAG: ATP-binding protein, partial [Candidatus Neomarinimicrobiota bacterium]